jgi:glucokinase
MREIFLGIDLGGTEVKAAALNPAGEVLWSGRASTGVPEGREAVLSRIEGLIRRAGRAMEPAPLAAVGIAAPAVIDMDTGTLEHLSNFTAEWDNSPLRADMERRTGLPIFVLNDVRAATVAEQIWGAGRYYQDFISVAIGTGIGGGLVLNGHLYGGSRGAAGEIGHVTMAPDGLPCGCGNIGCLETVASGPAIARAARAAIERGDADLSELAESCTPTPAQVTQAAQRGSESARVILAEAGRWIGLALGNLICVLNPRAVIVGGGVAAAGDLLLDPMRVEIERRTVVFPPARGGVVVVGSPLGGAAGAMGAAGWAMRQGGAP